ncbi:MAG: TVP38/TMEM64 family protein [Deltaproteobacteria bacterium]|nr:TVP38/TMEM64 family protein [Deltaproteobacteria bacterium]
MKTASRKAEKFSHGMVVKGILLCVFAVAAVCLIRFTPLQNILTQETLGRYLERIGLWAPFAFILFFATAACFFVPASILTFLGAAIFGSCWGFLYVWIGAMLGASAGFMIARTLGRDFASALIGDRLGKYDDAIARNGFTAVLYLRLIGLPFTPLNFGMGLTKVGFWAFFWGTSVGLVGGLVILSYFGGTLKEIWTSGNWGNIICPEFFISLGLLALLVSTPIVIRKLSNNRVTDKDESA